MSRLSDYISIQQRYKRAVNLTTDTRDSHSLGGLLVTPVVSYALDRILCNLESSEGTHSFVCFGPYGAGKSTFAVFACALFSGNEEQKSLALAMLTKANKEQASRFSALMIGKKGYLSVPITARRKAIGLIISEGLLLTLKGLACGKSGKDFYKQKELVEKISTILEEESWRDSGVVLEMVKAVQAFATELGFQGVLLIIDEAGKSLEYALQDRDGGDVFVFQQLAEYANRPHETPILFLTIQHQYFESYVELSNATMRCEWEKVQERFETIHFATQLRAGMMMLGQVFEEVTPRPSFVNKAILEELIQLRKAGFSMPYDMQDEEFEQLCYKAWPLHPTVILTLPALFKKLAQNERSLFSFLASQEPHGFQAHCTHDISEDTGFVRLADLAAYLISNMAVTLSRRQEARALLSAAETAEGDTKLTLAQQRLLYSASILSLLGANSALKATADVLVVALAKTDSVIEDLSILRQRSLLTQRAVDGTYRLWEGGDVDIATRIQEARHKLRFKGESFIELVREHILPRPLVVRKHSLLTGAQRYFDVTYLSEPQASSKIFDEAQSCLAGQIQILLSEGNKNLVELAKQESAKNPRLVFAIPQEIEMLRFYAEELACLHWVEDNTPELRDDRIASKEFALQLGDCERNVRQNTTLLIDPRPAPQGNACLWIWNGTVHPMHHPVDVARLLSTVCDTIYNKAPCIRNELIARPFLSSAGTAARTSLLKSMLLHSHLPNLGMEKFPPERSMYSSVLLATGLHKKVESQGYSENGEDVWHLQKPVESSALYPLWDAMETCIFSAKGEKVAVTELFKTLTLPPYGVPEGLLPVLLLAFYLCDTAQLFLYREGSFLSQVSEGDVELLQRRPDLFSISGVVLEEERLALVQRYAHGLGVVPTIPAVVEKLYASQKDLPYFTLHTSKLKPTRGKALRDTFRAARSPEQFLFKDLPKAFGMKPMLHGKVDEGSAEAFAAAMRESMIELMNFISTKQSYCEKVLLKACGFAEGPSEWERFVEQAAYLAKHAPKGTLSPLLQRMARKNENRDDLVQGVISIIRGKALERWNDTDVHEYEKAAQSLGEQFKRAWDVAGSSFLSSAELQEKRKIVNNLLKQTEKVGENYSPRVVAEALRDVLRFMEEKARG